ncbi:uncharacterized protein [Primulina huaijiensis]|uniref:uncharacterized protein isoform X2 n=1 Tax=Primulina huaijiensis TaxID=1492673 RepID=UPI003CC70166
MAYGFDLPQWAHSNLCDDALLFVACFSWELASALKESKELFNSAGVKLIAVGVGTPDKARLLAERLPFPVDILYADPDRKTKVFSRIGELKKV